MKVHTLLLPVLLLCSGYLGAQSAYLLESGNMTIAGTSTIHDWESEVTKLEITADFLLAGNMLQAIENLRVSIPAEGIISGRGNTMDKKTYTALRSEEYPNITYTLDRLEKIEAVEGGFTAAITGTLMVAGMERPVDLTVRGSVLENGRLRFLAERSLDMTDFEIVPPKALFGTLQTGELVTIRFDVVLVKDETVE